MKKNGVIIALSALLAVAVVALLLVYRQSVDQKAKAATYEKKLSELDEGIIQLKRENKDLQGRVSENAKEYQNLQSVLKEENRKLQGLISDTVKEKNDAETLIAKLRANHEGLVSELNKAIEDRDLRIGALTDNVRTEKARAGELMEKNLKAQESTGALEERVSALQKERDASEHRADRLRSDYERKVKALNQEIEKRDLAIADIEGRFAELFGERERLEVQMHQMKSTYSSMASELKNQIQRKEVTIRQLEHKLTITFVNRILFEFGKATISGEGREILARVGKILKGVGDKQIRIVGHTDNIPIQEAYHYKFPSNWELSAARSAAVVRFLQEEVGIDPGNLEVVGRALYDPVATNETEEGRAQNRRVNIVIAPRMQE